MKMVRYSATLRFPASAWVLSVFFALFTASQSACQSPRPAAPTEAATGGRYDLLYTIPVKARNFTTDKLQNIYILTGDNEVIKYTPDGKEQFRYPNRTLGDAAVLDATNPFLLLLFFPGHQTVLTLDRTMNLSGQFNLLQFGLFRVNALGMAGDGRLWVYDEVDFRLKKIAMDGTVTAQGNDLSLVLGRPIRPDFLVEQGQLVYLNDPAEGILVFDVFGQYQKTLPLKNLREFQVFDEQLVYFTEGKLFSFHLKALLERPVRLPDDIGPNDLVKAGMDRLFVLAHDGLRVYRF